MRRRRFMVYILPMGAMIGGLIAVLSRLSHQTLVGKALEMAETTRFDQAPVFVGSRMVGEGIESPEPAALSFHKENLLVSYMNSDRIDEYSGTLEQLRSFHLLKGEPASLAGLSSDSTRVYAADALSGELLIADYQSGELIRSIGSLPDNRGRIKLTNVTCTAGNIYATDAATRQVLVISPSAIPGVRDEWELMLHFPARGAGQWALRYPTAVLATPDGRLLVSDVGNRDVKGFTCNGRFAHMLEQEGEAQMVSPMGMAQDGLPSPGLLALADTVFHPSGVYGQGRIHITDATLARVKVFDTLGGYVLTYGAELRRPRGIVIDQERRLILVADGELHAIMVYTY